MLNMLSNHRTSKSIGTLFFPFANVKITKGLTITFYNYIILISEVRKKPLTPQEFYFFFFFCQIVRSNTAKPIIYNSQMTNTQTEIFAAKQGKCQISFQCNRRTRVAVFLSGFIKSYNSQWDSMSVLIARSAPLNEAEPYSASDFAATYILMSLLGTTAAQSWSKMCSVCPLVAS